MCNKSRYKIFDIDGLIELFAFKNINVVFTTKTLFTNGEWKTNKKNVYNMLS